MGHGFSQAEVARAYEIHGGTLKKSGSELHGPCPNCGGTDRFFVTAAGAIGCRGCAMHGQVDGFKAIMSELGLSKSGDEGALVRYSESPGEVVAYPTGEVELEYGCTIDQYSERIGLPKSFLCCPDVGLTPDATWVNPKAGEVESVRMPSLDANGAEIGAKQRIRIEGKDKYRYEKGTGPTLYGEQWVPVARQKRSVIVAEGESDSQTCWYHKIPCYGIPGASMTKVIEARHFEDIDHAWIIQEPGEAGSKFPGSVAARLRELGMTPELTPVELPAKDVNDLYRSDPLKFKARFRQALKAAQRKAKSVIWTRAEVSANAELREIEWMAWPMVRRAFGVLWAPSYAGKTTLALQLCVAVATGRPALGCIATKKRGVRLVGLEMGDIYDKRRTWDHVGVKPGDLDGADFQETSDLPRMGEGGLQALDRMLKRSPDVGLVVVDNLNRIRDTNVKKGANAFYEEGAMLERMERVQKEHDVCLMLIHHSTATKARASGTEAINSIPRTTIHLDRPDADEPHGEISAMHNGAAGGKFKVALEPGRGWRVQDPDFEVRIQGMGIHAGRTAW